MVLAGLLAGSPAVTALEIEPGVGVGLLYTDNATLSANDEEDDLIVVGYAGAQFDENTGPFRLNAEAELIHLHYTGNTYSNQNYPGLRLTAGYEQIRDRLDWQVQNYFTQTLRQFTRWHNAGQYSEYQCIYLRADHSFPDFGPTNDYCETGIQKFLLRRCW